MGTSFKIESITPEIAREYLSHNVNNRRIKAATVQALVRDIKNGDFVLTHQGIAFDEDGTLIDGQHRLQAVITAGTPVRMMVTRGLSKRALMVVDRGNTRSLSDIMNIGCYGRTDRDAVMLRNAQMLATLRSLVNLGYAKNKVTATEILRLFDAFHDEAASIYDIVLSKKRPTKNSSMLAAAVAAMHSGVRPDAIMKFFEVFFKYDVTGCDGYNVKAALDWKRQFDDARVNRVRINSDKMYLGTQNAIYHFVNNTSVERIATPELPRYSVRDTVGNVLSAAA